MDKGAHFHRCDFQVHTPRDQSWKGNSFVDDESRRNYAKSFIQACREKSLNAVAITDHHDLCFFKYIREAAQNEATPEGVPLPEEQRTVVFPGIELTLNIPCQAILILDSDFPVTLLTQVLTVLAITPNAQEEEKAAQVQRLDPITTFEELKHKLDEHDFLKNRYIIFPNVTSGGSDTLLRDGVANKYRTMTCVGGYLDGSIEKCDEGDLNILSGKVAHYGNKRVALFQTSDSRSEDHSKLGTYSTWVKWSVPTAEALRQACLAQESRISQFEPELPSVVIQSIQVSNSEFLGPIDLSINPQYTALIGSRGTGKSTVLEYLRWGLCDEHQNHEATENQSHLIQQRKLIENTLTKHDASVEVRFTVNGVPHMVRRKSNSGDVFLKIGEGELTECTHDDIRSLLPIQAYSQKQLSRVGVRIDELDRFVRSGIKTDLDSVKLKARSIMSQIRQVYSSVRRKQNIARSIREDRLNLESLTKQAQVIRESLTGLTEDQRTLIAKQPLYANADLLIEGWKEEVTTVGASLNNLIEKIGSFPASINTDLNSIPEFDLLTQMYQKLDSQKLSIDSSLKSAEIELRNIVSPDGEFINEYNELLQQWDSGKLKFTRDYSVAKSAATSHEAQLKILTEIEQNIGEISKRIDQAEKESSTLGNPEEDFKKLQSQWVAVHKHRGDLYESQCTDLTTLSDGAIKAIAHKGTDVGNIAELLKSTIKGSGIRTQKIDDFLDSITASEDSIAIWDAAVLELEILSQFFPESDEIPDVIDTPNLLGLGFTKSDLVKIASKITPEIWLEVVLTPMEDKTTFEYQTKEGEYIPFEHASAGQQATALLFTLLNQSGPPLIIDQPEDDLDNQIIFDIVTRLWKAKTRRQIIFSSHNANLVVNGDAELVICCDYRMAADYSRGHIANEGAIDIPIIRDSIQKIMEGGEKAFRLRLNKYGF